MSKKAVLRQEELIRYINEQGQVSIEDLTKRYAVSEATIRRDLAELDACGRINRVFGGARRTLRMEPEPPIEARMSKSTPEKEEIGRRAAALITPGNTVFISSGTTAYQAARFLANYDSLTVITNSLPVMNLMCANSRINLIAPGGLFRHTEQSFIGHLTEQALGELRADYVIMGIRAIHLEHGLTNDYQAETSIDRLILNIAEKAIIVAESSKFNRIAPTFLAPIKAVQTIVTDNGIDEQLAMDIRQIGVSLIFTD